MPHPHNAENIREILNEVLQEWCIPSTKVGVVITDNGSNMVKAFRQDYITAEGDDANEEDESDIDVDLDSMDESDDASTTAEDEEDFESREFEHEIAFQKRLCCFTQYLTIGCAEFQ